MANLPSALTVKYKVEEAIRQNKRPRIMLWEFLGSGSKEANVIANWLIDYKETIKVLTSKQGRVYLHFWLDDTLDYLEVYANKAEKSF